MQWEITGESTYLKILAKGSEPLRISLVFLPMGEHRNVVPHDNFAFSCKLCSNKWY
jgi:hypothetical protein